MPTPPENVQRRERAWSTGTWMQWLLLIATFGGLACVSWRTWPDILVDFGQELYVPWRLAEGEVLYRDLAWVTGPLSVYLNALWFRLFGVSLTTLIVANLVILAGVVALLQWLFRQCTSPWSATWCCQFFLVVFAFGQYAMIGNYNYVCPYRHDMTHGLALCLAQLACLIRFGQTRRLVWLLGAGFTLGLVSLAKVELALAATVTTAAAWSLWIIHGPSAVGPDPERRLAARWRHYRRPAAGFLLAAACAPVIAVSALAVPLGWRVAAQQVFGQYRLALAPETGAQSGFYSRVTGFDHPVENLLQIVLTALVVLGVLLAAYLIRIPGHRHRNVPLWSVVLWFAALVVTLSVVPRNEWNDLPAAWPVLLGAVLVSAGRGAMRDRTGSGPAGSFLLLTVFSLALLAKIVLRVRVSHYGFVLAAPATLVLFEVALFRIPAWLERQGDAGWCFRAVLAGVLTVYVFACFMEWRRIDAAKTQVVGTGADRFFAEPVFDSRTVPTVRTLAWLRERMQPGETLIVFPNGATLNYLLRARNPSPYTMFSPWESDVHGGEHGVARAVIRSAPDYAVIVTMDLTVHGRGNFGTPEFGGEIVEFLQAHYDVVFEDQSQSGLFEPFAVTVFHRRPDQG